jgi:hypothetical protein
VPVYAAGPAWHGGTRKTFLTLDELTSGLEPYPAPVPTQVRVNGVAVDDPADYAILFGSFARTQFPGRDVPVATIRIVGVPAPWYDDERGLSYYPAANTLHRGLEYLRPSPGAIALVEDDLVAAGSGSRSPSWPVLFALTALLVAAAWAAWRLYDRRPRLANEDPATRSPTRR